MAVRDCRAYGLGNSSQNLLRAFHHLGYGTFRQLDVYPLRVVRRQAKSEIRNAAACRREEFDLESDPNECSRDPYLKENAVFGESRQPSRRNLLSPPEIANEFPILPRGRDTQHEHRRFRASEIIQHPVLPEQLREPIEGFLGFH